MSKKLTPAARETGVRHVVHVSITNPDAASDLPCFRGKAELEAAVVGSGLSYCILRPTVLFGKEDVLINNIAWAIRHLPVFGVFGSGDYRHQPIYVDDLAQAAVERALGAGCGVVEAIGAETFTNRDLIAQVGKAIWFSAGSFPYRRSWLTGSVASWGGWSGMLSSPERRYAV